MMFNSLSQLHYRRHNLFKREWQI